MEPLMVSGRRERSIGKGVREKVACQPGSHSWIEGSLVSRGVPLLALRAKSRPRGEWSLPSKFKTLLCSALWYKLHAICNLHIYLQR